MTSYTNPSKILVSQPPEMELPSSPSVNRLLQNIHRVRVLVAIASYGEKNIRFLKEIIRTYQSMTMSIDVVVNSDTPKNVDAGVKVIVGLPGQNPHSLPFAHKRLFADNIDQYDLFVYSEDDMGVTEQNILEFLRATDDLQHDEIAGYIRYELGQDGTVHLPDVHGPFHWKPESVKRRGSYTVAEFTNEHAAFYIMTQAQVRRAIASGKYLCVPYEGRYDMLVTAATDPYTCCGFRKVICISSFDKFLIHHIPNRYVGTMGIPLIAFKEQIKALHDIQHGSCPTTKLCEVEPKILQGNWSKSYYENPEQELIDVIPEDARSILSVGCGWGALEVMLQGRGAKVTAVPLDSIIGASVASRGIEVANGTLSESISLLNGRKFDCVFLSNILHLLPDPWSALRECGNHVSKDGHLVIVGYNFDFLPYLLRRRFGIGDYNKLGDFGQSGVHPQSITEIKRELRNEGFQIQDLRWFEPLAAKRLSPLRRWPGQLIRRNWIIKARRLAEPRSM